MPYDREALWYSTYPTTSTFYKFIASLNQIRNQAVYKSNTYVTYKAWTIYSDNSVIAMRKGDTGYVQDAFKETDSLLNMLYTLITFHQH